MRYRSIPRSCMSDFSKCENAMALTANEQRLYDTLAEEDFESGKRDDELSAALPNMSVDERAKAINNLLSKKRVQMFKEPDGVLRYKPISADEAAKFRGLAREDMVVYQLIKQSGSKGIWTKDLKQQSNLSQPQITKTLKTLENKVLIKSVRSVTNKNRKVYMLYELEPSKEITGGNWYTNQQFDDEFINVLSENCLRYIRNQGFATVEEVHEFLRKIRIANVEISHEEMQQLVETLYFDGKVDKRIADGREQYEEGVVYYACSKNPVAQWNDMALFPCGTCPVFLHCEDDGIISPQNCEYYQEWLSF